MSHDADFASVHLFSKGLIARLGVSSLERTPDTLL